MGKRGGRQAAGGTVWSRDPGLGAQGCRVPRGALGSPADSGLWQGCGREMLGGVSTASVLLLVEKERKFAAPLMVCLTRCPPGLPGAVGNLISEILQINTDGLATGTSPVIKAGLEALPTLQGPRGCGWKPRAECWGKAVWDRALPGSPGQGPVRLRMAWPVQFLQVWDSRGAGR